ncbi:MAG: RNA polymerase sigma factor, partial [Planctomycetota bacterium]
RTVSLDATPEEGGIPEPAATERTAAPVPLAAALERALQALPAAQREVFLLHAVEGFSHADAAAVLGITETNARVQYHRARTALRERLDRKQEGTTNGNN